MLLEPHPIKNILPVLLLMTMIWSATGCRTEIGGITSINEAADAANDSSVTFFPVDESRMTHHRGSTSTVGTEIVGLVKLVPGDADSDHLVDSSIIRITDKTSGRTYRLLGNTDSFVRDLGVRFDGRVARIVLDVDLRPNATDIRAENIVQYGPPD
jgi:hypothetical protein